MELDILTLNTYLKKIDRNMFYSKKLTTNYWISLINEKKISHNDEIYTFKQPDSLTNYFISIYKHKENLNSKIKKIKYNARRIKNRLNKILSLTD